MELKRNYLGDFSPSLDEFKRHIRMTSDAFDADLESKLLAAISSAEHFIGDVIALSEFTLETDFATEIVLPYKPLVDGSYGIMVAIDGEPISEFSVKGRTVIIKAEQGDVISITFFAGRRETEYDIKAAILLHAAALFNNPVDSVETLPKASTNLLRPHRRWGLR